MQEDKLRLLVVAPHHDDEVIGCGGTIAYLTQAGHSVDVVYLTAGYSGIPHVRDRARAIALREAEAQKAGRILGVSRQFFLHHPDRDLSYSLQRVQELVRIFRQGSYTAVYFPHNNEHDYEHRVAHHIASEAAWIANSQYFPELGTSSSLKRLMMYEVWTPLQEINFKQDISDFLGLKIKSLSAYESQFSPAEAEQIVGLNLYRGAMSSPKIGAAEAFRFYS